MWIKWYCISRNFHRQNFFVNDLFLRKLNTPNILHNVHRPIPILVAKVWRRNLDYAKNLQVNILPAKISQSTVSHLHDESHYFVVPNVHVYAGNLPLK